MDEIPQALDKTLCGSPEELRFADGEPVYNADGVDLSVIRGRLARTPAERLQDAQSAARFVAMVRARNPRA